MEKKEEEKAATEHSAKKRDGAQEMCSFLADVRDF